MPDADDEPEEITKVQKKDAATGKVFYIPSSKDPMAKAKVSLLLRSSETRAQVS